MSGLAHTPYDGSAPLFTIGLKPLDPESWIEVDDLLGPYLEEKDRLYASIPDKVFVEEKDTAQAQAEVLDMLASFLPRRFPQVFSRDGRRMALPSLGRVVDLAAVPPLRVASLLVQEDLVLMRKGEDGWRLAAASLCFPSSWSLLEKFGQPLQDIHAPVPGFARGTRNAAVIERIFDSLAVELPVERMNWSLQANADLYHPLSNVERDARASGRPSRFAGGDLSAIFIRVERQTLRKLPVSGDILFTIRIFLDPMRRLAAHPDRARIAAGFAAQLMRLDESQLDYKGLTADRDQLAATLRAMARPGAGMATFSPAAR